MTTIHTFAEHIRTLKNMEKRLRQIERKLIETDDKLDHIMFRLMEDDMEPYPQHGVLGHGNGQPLPESNGTNGLC